MATITFNKGTNRLGENGGPSNFSNNDYVLPMPTGIINLGEGVDSLNDLNGLNEGSVFGPGWFSEEEKGQLLVGAQIPGTVHLTRSSHNDGKLVHAGLIDYSGYYIEHIILDANSEEEYGENTNPFVHKYSTAASTAEVLAYISSSINALESYSLLRSHLVKSDLKAIHSTINEISSNVSDINENAISSINSNIASQSNAVSSSISSINSNIASQSNAVSSSISGINSDITSQSNAVSSSISDINSNIDIQSMAVSTSIASIQSTITSQSNAVSSSIASINSTIVGQSNAVSSSISGINSDITSQSNAVSSSISGINSDINSQSASVSESISDVNSDINSLAQLIEDVRNIIIDNYQDSPYDYKLIYADGTSSVETSILRISYFDDENVVKYIDIQPGTNSTYIPIYHNNIITIEYRPDKDEAWVDITEEVFIRDHSGDPTILNTNNVYYYKYTYISAEDTKVQFEIIDTYRTGDEEVTGLIDIHEHIDNTNILQSNNIKGFHCNKEVTYNHITFNLHFDFVCNYIEGGSPINLNYDPNQEL